MKLSIATDAISHDFETAVLQGLEWGIEYFELKRTHFRKRITEVELEDIDKVDEILKAHSISLSSISPGLFKVPLDSDLVEKEIKNKFEDTISIAHKLNVDLVVIFGFMRSNNIKEDDALIKIEDYLGNVTRRAEDEGITLLLENDRGLWMDQPHLLKRVVSAINSKFLKINWDPCNLIGSSPNSPYPDGYDIIQDYIGHLHIKDAKVVENGKIDHAMVGEGDVDWVGQFERLYKDNYNGFCVLEPHFGSRLISSRNHILETRKLLRIANRRYKKSKNNNVKSSFQMESGAKNA